MSKFGEIVKRELTGWKPWHIIWMVVANLVIIGVSIYMRDPAESTLDTVLNIVAAVTGVICVILCGLGKVSNYFFGTINVVLYVFIAFKAKYYGDVMLNGLYYFPTNIIGWVLWEKNVNKGENTVAKKRMKWWQDLIWGVVSVGAVFAYSFILKLLGGNLPLVDSMSTVFSVVAQILMIRRFAEQWIIWIIVDAVSVIMWVVAYANGEGSIAMLLMWSVYLGNAIIMFIKWMKESRNNKITEEKIAEEKSAVDTE